MLNNTAILVHLSIGMPPQTKKAKRASDKLEDQYGTAPKQARVNKNLFSRKDIKPLQRVAGQARTLFASLTLPYDEYSRIMPSVSYFEFTRQMSAVVMEFDMKKKSFLDNYHISLMRAESELKWLYKESDYPRVEVLADVMHISCG